MGRKYPQQIGEQIVPVHSKNSIHNNKGVKENKKNRKQNINAFGVNQ